LNEKQALPFNKDPSAAMDEELILQFLGATYDLSVREISKSAGLSVGTVARIRSGVTGGIHPSTRRKIQKFLEDAGARTEAIQSQALSAQECLRDLAFRAAVGYLGKSHPAEWVQEGEWQIGNYWQGRASLFFRELLIDAFGLSAEQAAQVLRESASEVEWSARNIGLPFPD
jgi:transcriptional regulator with XRE-family HTH domain